MHVTILNNVIPSIILTEKWQDISGAYWGASQRLDIWSAAASEGKN